MTSSQQLPIPATRLVYGRGFAVTVPETLDADWKTYPTNAYRTLAAAQRMAARELAWCRAQQITDVADVVVDSTGTYGEGVHLVMYLYTDEAAAERKASALRHQESVIAAEARKAAWTS